MFQHRRASTRVRPKLQTLENRETPGPIVINVTPKVKTPAPPKIVTIAPTLMVGPSAGSEIIEGDYRIVIPGGSGP